jgi:hypothetical protein
MKKFIYFLFLLILIPVSVFGQITGTGLYDDPYTGTLTIGTQTISSSTPVYFDQLGVSGGILVIGAGTTLFAVNTTSQITITSTGSFYAVGSSGNIITFSADNDGDGVPIDGETWKNILFDHSTGTSIIDNAIIERGAGDDNSGWGGGIYIHGNNITIRNSTIRNCNISGDGGGIYLLPTGANVTLQNLIIHDNSATGNGGGMVFDGEADATVTGCEIYNNSATTGYGVFFSYPGTISNSLIYNHASGEGVYISDIVNGVSLKNCVIYNNFVGIYFSGVGNAVNCDVVGNSTGLTSENPLASKIVNTVLFGNTTQYNIFPGASMELANCGIQGGLAGGTSGGGNITLSASNVADTGPNFVTPFSNLHINAAISPLVDGGISSYSGITAPSTDIEGKSRIGTLDIGAYEFFYYIWTGAASTTTWTTSGNWLGSPASVPTTIHENKVVIPKGCLFYPTASVLILENRSSLTIQPQAGLTVTGGTTIGSGCIFLLESDATGSASFIPTTAPSGPIIVKLFLAGGGTPNYKWHYVTTPSNGYSLAALTTDINNPFNLLNYMENRVLTDKSQGWNWFDGYGGTPGFVNLQTSKGYNVYVTTDQTATFTSSTIRGATPDFVNSSITCGAGDTNIRGWNLIGNPYTSAVDANMFILTPRFIDRSIYFTMDNQYMSWNTFTNLGLNGATNIVLPLQGFFVHSGSESGSKSVTIPASCRTYTTNSFYKGSKASDETKGSFDFPYLKFNVSDAVGYTDESIVYFFNDATTSFDTDYDAYKLFNEDQSKPQIYTVSDNISFGINGLPIPDKITTVPLNIRIGVAKDYTINVLNLENLTDCKVTLIHGTNRIDLKANPSYTFSAVVGTITDMAVEFDMSVPTDVNVPSKDQTACWYSNGNVFIKTDLAGFADNSTVLIYDLNGKVVFSKSNISLVTGETVEIPVSLNNGFYITSVTNKNIRLAKKMVISY